MKLFPILSGLLFVSFYSFSQDKADAGSYLSFIGTQYEEISKDMMSYTSAVAHGKGARKVEKRRSELLQQVKESERNVRKMKPFKADSKLRDSVASYFRVCQIVLNEDYGKILNLEDIAEQSYDDMEAYLLAKEKANQKLDEASDRASSQYEAFATANKIKLIKDDSKLSQKIKASGKVGEYHRSLYLLFFKSNKNEAYFLDALSRSDVNAMEQTKNALLLTATEDYTETGKIAAFQGDGSLKNACQQALAFYKKEGSDLFPVMIDFQLKKENFEKMKKAFDASSTKTDEQIDKYNKAIDDYNAWVKKASLANDESNKMRSAILKKWNDGSEQFLDNHTPKYK